MSWNILDSGIGTNYHYPNFSIFFPNVESTQLDSHAQVKDKSAKFYAKIPFETFPAAIPTFELEPFCAPKHVLLPPLPLPSPISLIPLATCV